MSDRRAELIASIVFERVQAKVRFDQSRSIDPTWLAKGRINITHLYGGEAWITYYGSFEKLAFLLTFILANTLVIVQLDSHLW